MGSGQSVRASHFQRTKGDSSPKESAEPEDSPDEQEHHISISNKMVERLVEDATLAGGAAAAVAKAAVAGGRAPRCDHKDNIYIEKLKCLDETHSEKYGLTIEDVNALAKRVEMRTDVMLSPEPVCQDCAARVLQCYNAHGGDPQGAATCGDAVGAFSRCVQEAGARRLRARTAKEAREAARRSRHMAHAREHALKDLAPDTHDPRHQHQ